MSGGDLTPNEMVDSGVGIGIVRRCQDITIKLMRSLDGSGTTVALQGTGKEPVDQAVVRLFYREYLPGFGATTLSRLDIAPVIVEAITVVGFPVPFERVAFVRVDLMKTLGREELRLD